MRWLPVFKKEMRLFFGSPVAYVVFTFFLLISGWFFSQIFLYYSDISMRSFMQPGMARASISPTSVMRPLFTNMSVVLLFFMPMLTMRLFAEEKKSGTMELLLTYPVRDGEVLFGQVPRRRRPLRDPPRPHAGLSRPHRLFHPLEWGSDPHRLPRRSS